MALAAPEFFLLSSIFSLLSIVLFHCPCLFVTAAGQNGWAAAHRWRSTADQHGVGATLIGAIQRQYNTAAREGSEAIRRRLVME